MSGGKVAQASEGSLLHSELDHVTARLPILTNLKLRGVKISASADQAETRAGERFCTASGEIPFSKGTETVGEENDGEKM